MKHYALLHARKEALKDLEEDLTDDEYEIAIRAIDKFFDYIEEEIPVLAEMVVDGTKVHEITIDNHSSDE